MNVFVSSSSLRFSSFWTPTFRPRGFYETTFVSRSMCQYVSVSVISFFSKVAHRNFLNFYIKLEGLKDQKLTETSFSEKFLFLGKKL